MVDVRQPVASRVEELALRLERLEARVGELEAARAMAGAPSAGSLPREEEALHAPSLPAGTLALVGRTLLVLAGAYLARALTDGRVLPAAVGVGLGLAYAAFWQLRADREARAGRLESAAFHDVASSLVAFPLIWETAARLGLLGPRAAYAALVAFFALGLGVAWRRRLAFNAWLTTGLALATGLALLVSSHDLLAALVAFLAIAAVLEWTAYHDAWLGLRWPVAAVLDGVAFLLLAVVTRPRLPETYVPLSPGIAAAALLALPALSIVGVAARTLRRGRPVTCFEAAQGTMAVLLGFGGAWSVLAAHGMTAPGPGALAVLLGGLCYAVAFAFVERRPGQGRNFYFYSTAGGVLTLVGTLELGLVGGLSVAWAGLGLAAAALGRRFGRMTLRVHSALYLAAGALESGLIGACTRALAGRETDGIPPAAWVAGAAALGGWAVLATDAAAPRSGVARVPQLLLATLSVLAFGKAAQAVLWAVLGARVGNDPGAAAVLHTAVLAVLALGLAGAARRGTWPELGWLVYPLVAAGGVKLLLQDLREGRPATLVASLALYGTVLLAAPRLMRPGAHEGAEGRP
jgi:hypothetical protein